MRHVLLVLGAMALIGSCLPDRPAPRGASGAGASAIPDDHAWTLAAVALGRARITGCGAFELHRRAGRLFEVRCGDGRSHEIEFPEAALVPYALVNGRRIDMRR